MDAVLIANRDKEEARFIAETVGREYKTHVIHSPREANGRLAETSLILLDHNFTDSSGIDFLVEVLKETYIPVLMLTPADDASAAIESIRAGAYNYVVKTFDYLNVLNLTIKEAINKFNEVERMKETIVTLKARINELESRLAKGGPGMARSLTGTDRVEDKKNIVEEIITRFKKGEINLPPLNQITVKFRELIIRGADLGEIADLLKQDIAISSKLISVSNSPYYRSIIEHKTVTQAVSRLGINTTRRYVDVIANRSLYTARNKKIAPYIEALWEHSLSCAYTAQVTTDILGLDLNEDPFTMGLFHDLGKLVLLQVIEEMEIKGRFGTGVNRKDLIRTLNTYHCRFGAALLKRWRFPSPYIEAAYYHDNLEEADNPTKGLLIVHFSNLLSKHMKFGADQEEAEEILTSKSARLLDLTPDLIERVKREVERFMRELTHYFA